MTRRSFVDALAADKQVAAVALLRANRHLSLDQVKEALEKELGIQASRSAVHRFLVKLAAYDRRRAAKNEDTIITIVERTTGEVRIISTSLPASTVEALIRQSCPIA